MELNEIANVSDPLERQKAAGSYTSTAIKNA